MLRHHPQCVQDTQGILAQRDNFEPVHKHIGIRVRLVQQVPPQQEITIISGSTQNHWQQHQPKIFFDEFHMSNSDRRVPAMHGKVFDASNDSRQTSSHEHLHIPQNLWHKVLPLQQSTLEAPSSRWHGLGLRATTAACQLLPESSALA